MQNFVISSDRVAWLTRRAIEQNLREVNVPKVMALGAIFYQIFPRLGDGLVNSPIINRK